jgi:hypothetical protein
MTDPLRRTFHEFIFIDSFEGSEVSVFPPLYPLPPREGMKTVGKALPLSFFELIVLLAALPEIRKERCEQKKEGKPKRNG